jgi:hypothetical protein
VEVTQPLIIEQQCSSQANPHNSIPDVWQQQPNAREVAKEREGIRTCCGGGPSTLNATTFSPLRMINPSGRFSCRSVPPFFALICEIQNKIANKMSEMVLMEIT